MTSNGHTTQPLLSDFLNTPVVFQDASATFSAPYQGIAASLSSAETISLLSGNVQEAYGTIQAGSDSVTVTEDDYWAPSSSHGSSLFGSDYFL